VVENVTDERLFSRAAQHVAGGRPGSERAARYERSSERGRGAALISGQFLVD
jgi:hypothetical protein